jgi:hypothetical protein
MKIKADFVTNSSSTAFIVFIPPNYKIPDHELQKIAEDAYNDDDWGDQFKTTEDFKKRILEDFEDFIENGMMWLEDTTSYYWLSEFLNKEFGIISFDVDSSNGQMHNIPIKKIKDIIAVHELIKMKDIINDTETQK